MAESLIIRVKNSRLIRNSVVFFIGTFISSAGGYLFHFLMARMLDVKEYGELQSLVALSVILGIPATTLMTVIVRYTARFKAKEETGKIYVLFRIFTKKILVASLLSFIVFALFSGLMADFLQIASVIPLIILGGSFLSVFLFAVNKGILQGLQKFKELSIVNVAAIFFKVVLAVLLVGAGLGINGSVLSLVVFGLFGYAVSFYPLKSLFTNKKEEKINGKEVIKYSLPVFFSLLCTSLLFNLDIILAKHFLNPEIAGQYGALSVIGHVIFFITGPIVSVMFPMVAHAHVNGKNYSSIAKNSVILVLLIGFCGVAAYFLMPGLIVKILVGGKFLSVTPHLGWFGLSMLFYSLIFLIANYLLSVHRTKYIFILALGVLLQGALISLWHGSLRQIVTAMNVSMGGILVLLLAFVFFSNRRRRRVPLIF